MVQEITPTRLGDQVGAALQRGAERGSELGFQRGMTQNALGQLSNLPSNASAFDLAQALIGATAGIPGAERYVGTLFPLLLNRMRGQQTGLALPGAHPGQQIQTPLAGQGAPSVAQAEDQARMTGVEPSGQPQGRGQFQSAGGYLRAPWTEDEKIAYANQYALGDPTKLQEGLQVANDLSAGAQEKLNYIQQRLTGLGVSQKELPYATQIAERMPEKDPEKLLPATMQVLDQVRALDNALVPGLARGIVEKGGKAVTEGLIPALLTGGVAREKALKGIQPAIDNLVKKGYEPIARDKLAALGLSRTEVEERIHPMSKELDSRISSFPRATSNAQRNEKVLEDFILKNVKPGVSLLSLRHKLWKEKGYDWQQTRDAFRKAVEAGLPVTQSQSNELTEFTSQPPRDSLVDIFKDWGRPFDYLTGRK